MSDTQMQTVPMGTDNGLALAPTQDEYGLVEAQVRAEIAAQHALAVARPRDLDQTRAKLLKDAKRPRFAEVAEYRLPRAGKEIRGASIRFAESAYRAMGNLSSTVAVLRDTFDARTLRVKVIDLEANIAHSLDIEVSKTMERKHRDGYEVVNQRINSSGQPVYLVRAPEGELLVKQAAQVSKALRTLILRVIPGDLIEEALDECHATLSREDQTDPDAARKRLADAFGGLNVEPADLARYLGHPLSQCSPAEIAKLRGIYAAIKDGQTTWQEVVRASEQDAPAVDPKPGDKPKTSADKLKQAAGIWPEPPKGDNPHAKPGGGEYSRD